MKLILRLIGLKMSILRVDAAIINPKTVKPNLYPSDGTARVISKLCNASLVIGHSQSADRITSDIVMQAINDSTLG